LESGPSNGISTAEQEYPAMSDVLMTVATFGDPVEANLAKNYLEASGVQAFLADEETVNMDWALGNAIGRIKLQVGDQHAEAARTLLSQHTGLAATAALGPEEIRYEPSQDEPTPRWEDLDEDGDQDQDQEADDFEPEPTTRDKNAERAFKGAIFGLLFFPLQFYAFYLLLKVFLSEEPLGDGERRKAIIAGVINLPLMAGVCLIMVGACLIILRSLTQTL
jgi:hypothetical protein